MKINIKFWIAVILISSVIIFFKNTGIILKNNYLPTRVFNDQQRFLEPVEDTLIGSFNVTALYSDHVIANIKTKSAIDSNILFGINFYNRNDFSQINNLEIKIPNSAQLIYPLKNAFYYIDKFSVGVYSFNKNSSRLIAINNFKCFDLLVLSDTSIIMLGEFFENKKFETGFFKYNLTSTRFEKIHVIEQGNLSIAPQNSLIFSGKFTRLDVDNLCYYCDKYSKYFIFDNGGEFLHEYETIDKTPKPQIITDGSAFYYKRGFSYNVNNAVLKSGDNLLVFSCRSNPVSYLTIDVYHYPDNKYLFSQKVNFRGWTCPDIIRMSSNSKNVIINFQHGVGLFNIKNRLVN